MVLRFHCLLSPDTLEIFMQGRAEDVDRLAKEWKENRQESRCGF